MKINTISIFEFCPPFPVHCNVLWVDSFQNQLDKGRRLRADGGYRGDVQRWLSALSSLVEPSQLFLFLYFILLTECWVCTGHISIRHSVLSPADSGSRYGGSQKLRRYQVTIWLRFTWSRSWLSHYSGLQSAHQLLRIWTSYLSHSSGNEVSVHCAHCGNGVCDHVSVICATGWAFTESTLWRWGVRSCEQGFPSLSASYFDIYNSQNEQSKINVHISYVEINCPTFLFQKERKKITTRQRWLKFCSKATQLLKPQSVNTVNVPC